MVANFFFFVVFVKSQSNVVRANSDTLHVHAIYLHIPNVPTPNLHRAAAHFSYNSFKLHMCVCIAARTRHSTL